jgi:hypothetical protein
MDRRHVIKEVRELRDPNVKWFVSVVVKHPRMTI